MKLDLLTIIAASERLDRITAERLASFETQDFRRRRAAMLKVTRPAATS